MPKITWSKCPESIKLFGLKFSDINWIIGGRMKVFVSSDPHGNMRVIKEIVGEVNDKDYDVFLGLGDFMSKKGFSELVTNLKVGKKSFIQGNRDYGLRGLPYLKARDKFDYEDIRFVLIGSQHIPNMEEELINECKGFEGEELIMASHEPPLRARDQIHSGGRIGVPEFREVIKEVQPLAWCCGHVHEAGGVSTVGNTKVVNAAVSDKVLGYKLIVEGNEINKVERVER